MLKKLIIILSALILILPQAPLTTSADEADIPYAYLKNETILYSKSHAPLSGNTYTPKTTLPKTYFVALLESPSSSTDGYIFVNYLDITGYVALTQIEIVDYEPVYKYAEPTLSLYFDGKTIDLRNIPDHTITQTPAPIEIPSGTTVTYYGTVEGTAMFAPVGTTWYYIRYIQSGSPHYGYIYSAQSISVDPIPTNTIEKVPKPDPKAPGNETPSPKLKLTPTTRTALIICLSIPAVLIMLLLFQPQKKPRHPRP